MNTPKVFMLVTCDNAADADRLPALDNLRVGFPRSEVVVFDNNNSEFVRSLVREKCQKAKTQFASLPARVDPEAWMADIIRVALTDARAEKFFFCDQRAQLKYEVVQSLPSAVDANVGAERVEDGVVYFNPAAFSFAFAKAVDGV